MIQNTKYKILNTKMRGFGMLEIIIALTIFSMGVLSAMASLAIAFRSASTSHLNLIAANLAQEGLEIVRNIRDTNWIQRDNWDEGLAPGTYKVVWNSNSLNSNNPTEILRYDGTDRGFNYTQGTPTVYTRTVNIITVSSEEMRVVITVTWRDKATTKSISAESHLYNWR